MEFLEGIEPREYQQKIFETCSQKNCLVVLPTGLGKTLIALMLTIHRMKQFPGEKVVFLAPTKPLAEQHLKSFKKYLPELFGDMQLFTGQVKSDQRKKIWKTADIIFSTPQCVANDLKKELYNMKEVCLLVEDEAHRCVKNYDYNYLSKRYQSQSNNPRILGLTASPGSETRKITEICRNLAIETVEVRTRDSPDVKQYLQEREFEKVVVDFPPRFEEIRQVMRNLFEQYVEELRRRNVLYGVANKITLIKLQQSISRNITKGGGSHNFSYMIAASACAQAIKLQHAMELLETQTIEGCHNYLKDLFDQAAVKKSKGVVRLVAKRQFNYIYSASNELLVKKQEHPKVAKLKEIIERERKNNKDLKVIVFTQFRETASILSKNLNEIEGIKSSVFMGQAKKKGKGMNQKEQKKMVEDFSEGKINILCATSIAEEGLDIPEVNAVIFYEPIPSAIRSIQRAGRTARLMEGKLIILITKNTRDESHFYVSRSREKKMASSLEIVKNTLERKGNLKEETQKRLI